MLRMMRGVLAAFFAALVLFIGAHHVQAAEMQEIRHIELLKAINAARGKVVVINFFASWCQPCKMEIPGLINIRRSLPEDELVLLGVSMDEDLKALQKYMETTPFNFPVYHGDINVARVFQVSSLPKMLIYNARGGLVAKHDGFVTEQELRAVIEPLLQQ